MKKKAYFSVFELVYICAISCSIVFIKTRDELLREERVNHGVNQSGNLGGSEVECGTLRSTQCYGHIFLPAKTVISFFMQENSVNVITPLLQPTPTFPNPICLISCALIGSFLSSIRVQTDGILIYASRLAFNS